jgi:hypothetical protein
MKTNSFWLDVLLGVRPLVGDLIDYRDTGGAEL